MTTDVVLPQLYALVLVRRLADDDIYRAAYEKNPAQALREIGVPEDLIARLPPGYASIKLGSKLIFQTALYQLIDEVATICLCQIPPQVRLAIGDAGPNAKKHVTTPFEAS